MARSWDRPSWLPHPKGLGHDINLPHPDSIPVVGASLPGPKTLIELPQIELPVVSELLKKRQRLPAPKLLEELPPAKLRGLAIGRTKLT